ncbi:MAG: cytochrome c [Rhodothermales bacterium]|nr:cytochrome c [Rhodothermales bacterium]
MHRLTLIALVAAVAVSGCRGSLSDAPPVHINPNMDQQERFDAQEANRFFEDGRAMRLPVAGTVARGFLKEDVEFWEGRTETGEYVESIPMDVSMEFMERGRERYDIYCSVCHGISGDGQGIIMTGGYGMVQAPTYHSDFLRDAPDGYLYDVVKNGVRTMWGYGQQVPVADRWAIVAYVRALQRSQNAAESDVPENQR